MSNEEFRFSPRENRAHEIAWRPWGEEAFEAARAQDKPILLSISAVWCHWCHVMDETTYSDPEVIAAINERYVPVRVDNDKRPDVNARYNAGGWPTTAFLAPDGMTLTAATYLPPDQMRRVVEQIAQFYRERKTEIAQRALETRGRKTAYKPSAPEDLREAMVVRLVEELLENFDEEYAGFGEAPKFPQPELLEFLLSEYRLGGEQRVYDAVARTMLAMSSGGMYDRVEGGFFRYSTTRDWSIPHFEKMAEDHAGLLRVLAQLLLVSPNEAFGATLRSAVAYVRAALRDPQTHLFAGSQDADEEYFALPLEERRKREAPFVDRTSYTNWTAALAGAFALAGRALQDGGLIDDAMQTMDALERTMRDPDGFYYHFVVPGEPPQVRGLLTDQVAYLRAALDLHEVGGEERFLERAVAIAGRIVDRFAADDGGFYDRIALEQTIGRLDFQDRPVVDNGLAAESLLRLAALTGEARWRDSAMRALTLFARTFAAAGSFAATYARALRRALSPESAVRIVGTVGATSELREAASRLPTPLLSIRTLAPDRAAAAALPAEPAPAAYLCSGERCSAPVSRGADLRAAYETIPV